MINDIEYDLNVVQAKRLNISVGEFKNKITTEWWLYGNDILHHNVADKIVLVTCSLDLINTNVTATYKTFFDETVTETFSACPLIVNPI